MNIMFCACILLGPLRLNTVNTLAKIEIPESVGTI